MELDSEYFMSRLIALEKDIQSFKSECTTMEPKLWQYDYLDYRSRALHLSICAFRELELRCKMYRSPVVGDRVLKVVSFKPILEFVRAFNKFRELNSRLFPDDFD